MLALQLNLHFPALSRKLGSMFDVQEEAVQQLFPFW